MSQEFIDEEPENFDCDTCKVREALQLLDEENAAAWLLYRQLNNRFLVDAEAAGPALMRMTAEQSTEQFIDTCERLRVLHDTLQPPKSES